MEDVYKRQWYHRTKELHEDGTILYGKRGGFETAEDAEQSFYACKAEFDKAYHKYILESKLNKDISLKTYLEYWFDVIFSERIVSTTRMCSGYILKQTILPNIKEDVKLRYVTTEYIDALPVSYTHLIVHILMISTLTRSWKIWSLFRLRKKR